jgi:hypothetical protein
VRGVGDTGRSMRENGLVAPPSRIGTVVGGFSLPLCRHIQRLYILIDRAFASFYLFSNARYFFSDVVFDLLRGSVGIQVDTRERYTQPASQRKQARQAIGSHGSHIDTPYPPAQIRCHRGLCRRQSPDRRALRSREGFLFSGPSAAWLAQ